MFKLHSRLSRLTRETFGELQAWFTIAPIPYFSLTSNCNLMHLLCSSNKLLECGWNRDMCSDFGTVKREREHKENELCRPRHESSQCHCIPPSSELLPRWSRCSFDGNCVICYPKAGELSLLNKKGLYAEMRRRHCTFTLTGVMVVVCFFIFFRGKIPSLFVLVGFFSRERLWRIESSQNISDIEWFSRFSPCLTASNAADDWTLQQVIAAAESGLFVSDTKKHLSTTLGRRRRLTLI